MDLDSHGVFKYIQIRLLPKGTNTETEPVTVVRGYLDCPYHADILAKFDERELSQEDLSSEWDSECPGGGRINVDSSAKTLLIYGYSQGFGRCDHSLTQSLIQEALPDYEVTWSNEGY